MPRHSGQNIKKFIEVSVDPSLSKGLAGRFIQEHEDRQLRDWVRISKTIARQPHNGFSKASTWESWADDIGRSIGPAVISTSKFGNRKKELRTIHYLGAPLRNPLTGWDEDALPIEFMRLSCPYGVLDTPLNVRCLVGKHAIARLVQRHGLRATDGVSPYNFYELMPEMTTLAAWSSVWITLLAEVLYMDELPRATLTLPVPAPNGVFMANLAIGTPMLNIRTYVHDQQLTDRQRFLKNELASAMTAADRTLIECASWDDKIGGLRIGLQIVLSRVAGLCQRWLEHALSKTTNVSDARLLGQTVAKNSKRFQAEPELIEYYETHGGEAAAVMIDRTLVAAELLSPRPGAAA